MSEDWLSYPTFTRKGFMEAREGDGLVMCRPTRARGTVQEQKSPTLTCTAGCGTGVVVKSRGKLRIRHLTEKECWRLMGQSDEDFEKAKAVVSRTQLYKQAGNSIVVPVLEAIFRGMYIDGTWETVQPTLDDFEGAAR